MLLDYVNAAMRTAHYELIDDREPYYGELKRCPGVWAKGKSLEECRDRLSDALEDWLLISIARGLPIPAIGKARIALPAPVAV
ncbi:MAG: hypothetical protein COZ06_20190 [Armatimonadetes bacterium CG_4_10_14_3_um_filter_66_18]|nr:type II toxin-antitoxin system HicB family antitoxin [Armatimonadota bacterium]OIP04878.1 MAG: HicB family protein [Armatimonadetes bacterium CG2_30_66_41]PIU93431.1 MAG: hypothetical protein COS65_12740 [Armatimonadetes bacterium CG06_land_8_20_14_3_00_66_21]PIX42418.1 MAG: hypothetical protein COZ57_21240 [Armatimonadetes bacterium CG_4_8_14_3_um_filter_66_20]PIY44572.1 MAG: hypothetical protein COZ06_20190 [Armatimonadetes bacterium CG_4_10_14_3_um_filter_66_18]PIZ46570.1 MAG: hypothetic